MYRKGLTVGLIFLLVATSVFPITAQDIEKQSQPASRGNWLYVGGSGPGNYTRIQDAINNAITGDTIYVYDDSSPYSEQLTVNTTLTLIGENQTTTIINSTADECYTVITINADDVHLSGFTIVLNGGSGVEVFANHTRLSNLTLYSGIHGWSGTGIKLYHVHDTVITNILITRAQIAMLLTYATYTSITHNLIVDPGLNGIIVYSSDNIIDGNTIMGNLDPYTQPVGIYLSGSRNTVSDNTIKAMVGNATHGISLNAATDSVIEGNTLVNTGLEWHISERNNFANNTVNGKPLVFLVGQSDQVIDDAGQVFLINCTRMTVQNLTLFNSGDGIYLYGNTDSIVQHCHISSCWSGIDLEASQDNIVQNNTMTNCEYGISIYQGDSNRIENNTINGSKYCGLLISSKSTQASHNQIDACSIGITVSRCRHSSVTRNTIHQCIWGVYLEMATATTIAQNNFQDTQLAAAFYTAILNHWTGNYWGRSRILPKIIPGSILIYEQQDPHAPKRIIIPWINVDLHPVRNPYDISGMR